MKRLFFWIVYNTLFALSASLAGSIPIGWEIASTNAIGIDANGVTRTATLTIPITQNIIITGISYNAAMVPAIGWYNTNGFAEVLIFANLDGNGQAPVGNPVWSNVIQRDEISFSGAGPSGGLFSCIIKTTYPQNGLVQPSYTPLNLAARAGQTITLVMSYFSVVVDSDVEIQGYIQYE